MRLFLLANNWVGWQVSRFLKDHGAEVIGLAIHPLQKRKYGDEILQTLCLPVSCVFEGSRVHDPDVMRAIGSLRPDMGLSILFDYILRPEFIGLFPKGVMNLHPSYLPYNRGQYPNVWSIVEGTPAGATLHYVDSRIDTGDIVAQKQVPVDAVDTGETLYRKLERACVELFAESWPLLTKDEVPRVAQSLGTGCYHRRRDVERVDEIVLDRTYRGKELIDILRARTFPPYPGAYFKTDGRKVYLRLQLLYEDELDR
jgi:methionyl-tRNA formyltransferase